MKLGLDHVVGNEHEKSLEYVINTLQEYTSIHIVQHVHNNVSTQGKIKDEYNHVILDNLFQQST